MSAKLDSLKAFGESHFQPTISQQEISPKEVNEMRYETPNIIELASAVEAVQNSTAKIRGPVEVTDLMTVMAYESDE